jgi:hypothetical protein
MRNEYVIPAKAAIKETEELDFRMHGNDNQIPVQAMHRDQNIILASIPSFSTLTRAEN